MSNVVLQRIEAIADDLSAEGPVNEKLGRLSDPAAAGLRGAGVIRMLQPKSHGGLQLHPREFAETVMKIASLDGSSGWVSGVVGVHPWELAFADPKVQDEVWGEDPDTWLASPYAPMGVARPVDGGYLFSGRWQFSSGTDHCKWIFLGGFLGDHEGKPASPPCTLHLILPRSDYTVVDDSWDVVGLRGTGSKDIIVKDAFVPAHRTIKFAEVLDGSLQQAAGLNDPSYLLPFSAAFPLGITAAVVGIAEGGLAQHLAYQRTRVRVSGAKIKDDPYVLYAIGEAAAEISASRTALIENICRLHDKVAAGGTPTVEDRAVGRRIQIQAARRAVAALDQVVACSGGNAMRMDNPMQRFWRDAHMGLGHAIHVPGSVFHQSALANMGIDFPAGAGPAMI